MNTKLIEDIVEQCEEGNHPESLTLNHNKFVEMIVEECLSIMTKEENNTTLLTSYPPISSAIWNAKLKIKSHFGMK